MKNKISPIEYNKILSILDLMNIFLTQINAELFEDNIGKGMEIHLEESSNYKQIKKTLIIDYILEFSATNIETKNTAVKIKTSFRMEYSIKDDSIISAEFMDVFLTLSVSIQIWPYFREIIQNTISKMNLPGLVLPLKKNF